MDTVISLVVPCHGINHTPTDTSKPYFRIILQNQCKVKCHATCGIPSAHSCYSPPTQRYHARSPLGRRGPPAVDLVRMYLWAVVRPPLSLVVSASASAGGGGTQNPVESFHITILILLFAAVVIIAVLRLPSFLEILACNVTPTCRNGP